MSNGRLAGKVAIITGATTGIGLAAARRFAAEGAALVLAARTAATGDTVARDLRASGADATFIRTDVAIDDDVANLIAETERRHGRLNVLYANAGFNEQGTAPELSEDSWRRVIDANLGGQFHLAKHGIPLLAASGGGSVILTASEFGLVGARASVAYCAAKGGIINLARALAVDCGPLAIRVNCLTPGPIRTQALLDWMADQEDPEAFERAQTQPILLGRLGRPEEIAGAAVFLASDDSSFMTGSVLLADGGVTAWYGI